MVRETRHLWVGNLPDNIREDRIREHFKRYGRVQSVKLLPRNIKEETSENATACTVAFMDIKSASKAHTAEHKIDERTLTTEYYEPAAIPSAASPQNTNSTYSTSPGSTRFTNSHGTTEEHGNFNERFYERNNTRVAEGEYIRRPNYHDSRGRNRDRGYRNGPYNNVIDRHRPLNSSWSYDSTRSYNSEAGYGTTPSDSNDRRSSDSQSTKKKTKSRSGSRSVSPSGSTSSRSPTRSRSQSSSSSSSSTTSQASSSTGSPKSRRLAANASHQPVVHSDDRRPLAICVRNLPLRSSDTSLKDGLFHEYKKHGKVTWVKIVGQGTDRHAIVCFKKPEDVEKALEVSYDKLFFGCKIEVAPYQGYDLDDNELRPYEADIDEFHPKATRTLFIGNLEKDVTASDLRKHFDQFGEIIEIDIKKQGAVSLYAFCQYSDIVSVVKAIRTMDGEHLGNNRIKLGFGKSMPTNCVWVDGVVDSVNEKYLTLQFDSFGPITQVIIDRDKGQALVFYDQVLNAQTAVTKMRGVNMRGRKIQVDFAGRECQEAFYDHLEKQGHPMDRVNFEERRDSTTRTFEQVTPVTNRFTRYETPSRPRTTSYSSRTNATTGACNASAPVHSPSTPGSVTPRGSGSRSRLARFAEYYDPASTEYGDRRYRSYDEFSQGSAASHEDGYEHDYAYTRESPSNADPLESRTVQHSNEHLPVTFAPPDIRNLQKERYHLLEQLEDYTSSGDELVSPKKRLRLDLLEGPVSNDVIIETNREHRKVMEVRRTSDASLKHHSRRPSLDSKHSIREVGIDRVNYMPHAVCKRRKTAGSDSSARLQHHDLSGSESVGSSRPGTPLCDERPENFPTEPRRIPREREGPLSLPLPRFAAQILGKGSVSVAGIKGQKENILSSPPPAATSPRISNPVTPSLAQVPPPASPPPRPPSLSSNSSDSDITPPSPSLDERIRSLDEKYEKWSGSRAVSAAGSEALAKLDATASERFKFSYKLLDLDLKELQPSEIVKSVLAKPSVFDEDSKRLENVGEKYDFNLFSKATTSLTQSTVPAAPLSAPPILKVTTTTAQLPKTPTMLSPRSAGSNITTAKSLQYPFPSHPPLQSIIGASPTQLLQTPPPPSSTAVRSSHSDNRLKLCANSSSDNRTTGKIVINRNVTSNAVVSSLTQVKIGEPSNNSKSGVNIPINPSDIIQSGNTNCNVDINQKQIKSAREPKIIIDKVANRRDSVSSGGSPRCEIRNRRNSENTVRKSDMSDKSSDHCDTNSNERKFDEKEKNDECKRLEHEKLEKERLEKERLERERLEKERIERDRLEKERMERERLEKERLEKEKLEKEKLEKERIERELKREKDERERKEREEQEKREREEQERLDKERRDRREREEKERREEREKKEKEEHEKLERERKRDEERKHKDEHQEKRKDDHVRHREAHSDTKHKDTDSIRSDKNTKENRAKDNQDINKKDSHESRNIVENKSSHDNKDRHNNEMKKDDKNKHHVDRDIDKRKESSKENRENNLHEKILNIASEIKENNKPTIESRHFSIDLDKNKIDPSRRKERNNSLPANAVSKRRMSSQDTSEFEEIKKLKLSQEHRKISDRRDSKDSRSEEKVKNKHKNNIAKIIEDKMRQEKLNNVKEITDDKRKDRERDKDEKHKHKQKIEKQRSKEKNKEKESLNLIKTSVGKELSTDKELVARLEVHISNEELEKSRQRKEAKEKRKQDSTDTEDRKSDDSKKIDERKKEKRSSTERRSRDENLCPIKTEERKLAKKERPRKITHSSDAATDSDEPKKQSHSIFDIVDDEPAYISMYDKVKARSCKNMQKQEEEKRQEKLKAKFNQLKQSRAKREEKKRSTSWDEDSDSDHERRERNSKDNSKGRRGNKMLIMSSDDEEHNNRVKQQKKREMYTDSDSDKHRQMKFEHIESSDDDTIKTKIMPRKNSKCQIASDTSDDDFKKVQNKIKSEIFSDSEPDQRFLDLEERSHKRTKDEDSKSSKKEKKKHQDLTTEQISAQIFGESPLPDAKSEDKYDSGRIFGDISSAEENNESKKDKCDNRKKHKKKQKRQKHSITSEEDSKLELTVELIKDESIDRLKSIEKKKQHSKKEKKKDKNKDDDKHKDKSKKSKRSKTENIKGDSKRDGKMENIFGSFSDDSENGNKEQEKTDLTQNIFLNRFGDEKLQIYNSDSESISHIEKEIQKSEEKERKEEHKKRKEKKRRGKEKRLREEELNENSMDYVDMGKQLEANIKDDSNDVLDTVVTHIKNEVEERNDDIFRFTEGDESQEVKLEQERKENKEKKKKRKKSKEEKHKHHHHHHEKSKLKSPDIKKEFDLSNEKNEVEKPVLQSPSLPNILDLPSPPLNKTSNAEYVVPQVSRELLNNSTTKPLSKEKKPEKFIPGFGTEIDEAVHETAIKSISEFETPEITNEIKVEDRIEKSENTDDKPRAVISQEETEDAVAALLGESFGGNEYSSCFNDEEQNLETNEQEVNVPEENIVEDLEEMRQAVQSLNSGDLEIKPDTPQSEHDLQIDTDTEDQEDVSLRFENSPRTPDMIDLSQPPKTPDIPSYFRPDDQVKTTLVIKATGLTSPPSLTPIKPLPHITETKTIVENSTISKPSSTTEQLKPVITKSWPVPEPTTTASDISKVNSDASPSSFATTVNVIKASTTSKTICVLTPATTIFSKVPTIKIADQSSISSQPKQEQVHLPSTEPEIKSIPASVLQTGKPQISPASVLQTGKPQVSVSYNVPVHVQYSANTQQKQPLTSMPPSTLQTSKIATTTVSFNRLPITPVMMSKPFQPTSITTLQQPKFAQTTDSTVITNADRTTEQSRVVYQTQQQFLVNTQPQTRMIVQNLQLSRGIPTQTMLKHSSPSNYNYAQSSFITHTSSKDISQDTSRATEPPRLVPSSFSTNPISQSVISDSKQSNVSSSDIKPFMPVIKEAPKLVSISSTNISTPSIIQTVAKSPTIPQTISTIKTNPIFADDIKENKEVTSKETPAIVVNEQHVNYQSSETLEKSSQLPVEKVTELPVCLKDEEKISTIKEESIINTINTTVVNNTQVEEDIINKDNQETKILNTDLDISTSVIKKTEKIDEDKGETESICSDTSKERLSADLVIKDDGLDSKEDSDYWSAKELNIDSVIKKVDALCSADELSDRSSEIGKDDWFEHDIKLNVDIKESVQNQSEMKVEEVPETTKIETPKILDEMFEQQQEEKGNIRGGRRGGRTRGRKGRVVDRTGMQTRRAKGTQESIVTRRGGRGARTKTERKIIKSDLETADVYEFRDESDENKDRPRLILTIKSPAISSSNNGTTTQTAIIKEVVKETIAPKADFVSPTNIRKSRRLQERDISRNTVDDTIEDVVKNTTIATRSTTAPTQIRRSTRQTTIKTVQDTQRKSLRSGTRKKDRRASETADELSEEKPIKNENVPKVDPEPVKLIMPIKELPTKVTDEEKVEVPKEKPHEGLKAAVLRRVKGEINQQEPTSLIDPVTGLLTPMRECEEGRYIPVSGGGSQAPTKVPVLVSQPQPVVKPVESQQSVIANTPVVNLQQKPQSLKAHVLSSQAARSQISQQPQKLAAVTPSISQPPFAIKSNIPINQHLNVNVSSPNLPPAHLSPNPNLPSNTTKTHTLSQGVEITAQQPTPVLQTVNKQAQPNISKAHTAVSVGSNTSTQAGNTQTGHVKPQVAINKGQVIKPHSLQHPQPQILTGAVASPPLKQSHPANQPSASTGRLVQGSASIPSASAKVTMEAPKVEVSVASCVMVSHPSSSPQGQPRHVLQTGLPIPAFEANLGEGITHFTSGSVKLRTPHDLLPAHYMHPQHVMYQQYLRQPFHLPRSSLVSTAIEKTGDGPEGEEAPVELRRPGSGGLALSGRSSAVPHSMQSPHDRTTDSPQVGQVYNIHNSRMPHYYSGRYYEQTAEPPPAHQSVTSHASLAALNSDRSIAHIGPLGTSDRPLSNHSALTASHINNGLGVPERPLSTHIPPDRPLSNHGFTAAPSTGNPVGTVARHVGVEAPANQRGLQSATPPYASQYPIMWQGLLALKNDQAAVQMYFVSGNDQVAICSLPKNNDGSTPPLRIFQRMRLEPPQVEGVARKMQMENEHCMLIALPCGYNQSDVLQQSDNLTNGFITYLQQKQAAGIVNVAAPGTTQPPAYVVHIFPSCDFVNENLNRVAPSLLQRVSNLAHLLIVITTV